MTKRKNNQTKSKWFALLGLAGFAVFVLILVLLTRGHDIALLNPKGHIADEQYQLLITSTSIMLAFAAIVLFFIYFFAWKYRETNQNNTPINPRAGRSKLLIATAWLAPITVFVILVSIMIPATYRLEPQKPIESDRDELVIRVIAMRWKWVFMYPEQNIATVNFVQIPVDTPVRFELTADEAPMNGFWIPHLGGMLYSMTEHVNPLNLIAHTNGDYDGGAAEINGHGFADMRFKARVSTQHDFDKWVEETSQSSNVLDAAKYSQLLKPSENTTPTVYSSPTNQQLFDALLKKYVGSHDHYGNVEYDDDTEHEGH